MVAEASPNDARYVLLSIQSKDSSCYFVALGPHNNGSTLKLPRIWALISKYIG